MRRMMLRPQELEPRDCPAVSIRFDYTYDTAGFFNTQARRDALERAATLIESRIADNLSAITPNAALLRTWTATTLNPITNATVSLPNLSVAANEIVVYVAGGAISGTALAVASGGGYSTGPFPLGSDWPNIIKGRGQAGALNNTDFSPWGGFIGFDNTVNWNFATTAPSGSQSDFESVALHELLHVFGYGLGNVGSFDRYVNGSSFIGPNAISVYGSAVPLNGDHIANSVVSGGQTSIMVAAIPNGTERTVTPVDWAVLADIGWQLTTVPPPPPPPPPPTGSTGPVRFHVGSGTGREPLVAGLNATGGTVWNATPFDRSFTGGVRVASGDFNADGVLDVVVGTGPGIAAQVRVLNGATRAEMFSIAPFGTFTGGVYVAAGDITGDGRAELLISPDRGGGPRVRAFTGNGFTQIADFFGIDDVNFRGGARVALGDLNADNRDDVIVSAGFGGGPRIALFDGSRLTMNGGPKFAGDFFAFETSLRNGAFIAAGDLDGDGRAELVAGGGPGGGPRVSVFRGSDLIQGRQTRIADFFAGDITTRGGVNLAIERDNIITGAGEGDGFLASFDGPSVLGASNPASTWNSDYFRNNSGVFVG